jgi:hypothetical protein
MLDQGRIRMLSGEAIGKAATRALELRTQDGTFALRGADIEARSSQGTAGAGSGLTVVKVNAGDARLLNPQGGIAISKDSVQGIAAGNVVTDKSISVADVALTLSRPGVAAATPTALLPEPIRNLNLPAPTLPLLGPIVRQDVFAPVVSLPGVPLTSPVGAPRLVDVPPLTKPIIDLAKLVVNPKTQKLEPLGTVLVDVTTTVRTPSVPIAGQVSTAPIINTPPLTNTQILFAPQSVLTQPVMLPGTINKTLTLTPIRGP